MVDQKERRGNELDDNWYSDRPQNLEDSYTAPSATDEDLPPNHPSRTQSSGSGDNDLAAQELDTDHSGTAGSYGENAEHDALNHKLGNGYQPNKKSGMSRRLAYMAGVSRTKKLISGWLVVTIVSGIFTLMAFLSGPVQIMQFGALLEQLHFFGNNTFTSSRAGNLIRYSSTRNDPTARNLGYFGELTAQYNLRKLRAAGIEPIYQNRRMVGAVIDSKTPQGEKALRSMREQGLSIDLDGNGIANVDLNGSAHSRRLATVAMINAMDLNFVLSATGKRVLKVRGAVNLTPRNIVRAADESLADYRQRVRQETAQYRGTGINTTIRSAQAGAVGEDGSIQPGEPTNEQVGQATQEANELASQVNDSDAGNLEARSSQLKSRLVRGSGIAGFVALTCGVYQMGDLIYDIREKNINHPMIRTSSDIIVANNSMKANKANSEQQDVLGEDLYDEKTETGWSEARSIQHELGQPLTGPDLPNAAKPGYDRPAFFDVMDATIGNIPGGAATCGAVTSTVGGFILDGAGWAINSTGPIGFFLNAGIDTATGVAVSIFIDDVVRWLAGEQVDLGATGALLGNIANFGSMLLNNDNWIVMGAVALSNAEIGQLDAERDQFLERQLQEKSMFARYLDVTEPRSMVSQAMLRNPELSNPGGTMTAIATTPLQQLANLPSIFASLLQPHAYAQNEPYDYGFPEFGYSIAEMEDPRFEDPYENADYVEPRLEEFNEEYGIPCFGATINPTTYTLELGSSTKRYNEIADHCNNRSDIDLMRYRFYLADMTVAKSLACYEGLDEGACRELGFGSGSSTTPSSGGGSGVTLPTGDIKALANQILTSDNVSISNPAARVQISEVMNTGTTNIDHRIIRALAGLSEKHRFTISSLKRCTPGLGSGTNSLHCVGKAVDISGRAGINGSPFTYTGHIDTVQQFINDAAALLPDGCGLGVPNQQYVTTTESAVKPTCNAFIDKGSGPHVHLQVPR